MQLDNIIEVETADSRHEALLEAAVSVFSRYGFRKTSMDEVARAAGVSRQGLYLLFEDKEALFRKAVAFQLARQLRACISALTDDTAPLEARLLAACDAWAGRFVGSSTTDAADLMCASSSLAGATFTHYQTQFERALADAVAASALAATCVELHLVPADVARVLHATARGLKHSSQSRQEFVHAMTAAVRLVCARLTRLPSQE